MKNVIRFLIIGAHPDDPDEMFGGSAVKLARSGHKVKFVSCCNGDAGHFSEKPSELAARRKQEALAAAAVAGREEYEILDNHDCELMPTLEMRKTIIGIIRNFMPDIVISHRLCDYHADHRAVAQLVQDSAYLITVPLFCPEYKVPAVRPVYMFSHDKFRKPYPFSADTAVAIDDVINEKLKMLDCHKSQFYEWLPYNKGFLEKVPVSQEGRNKFLSDLWLRRNAEQADETRHLLQKKYGTENGKQFRFAEIFELSEYGRQPEKEELDALFPY